MIFESTNNVAQNCRSFCFGKSSGPEYSFLSSNLKVNYLSECSKANYDLTFLMINSLILATARMFQILLSN